MAIVETRRILLDGVAVEARRNGEWLEAPDGRRVACERAIHLPPVQPTKIICIHLNFMSRVKELKATSPDEPSYFHKPTSCLNSHRGAVVRPKDCKYLNYEGEVGIVIGRTARDIPRAEAEHYIGGYTIANDFGLHDFRDTDRGAMLRVKGSDTLGAVGPGLVTGWDYRGKRLRTLVNGKVVQDGTMDELIWDMGYLVADLARLMTLNPGDLILSGTPANSRPVKPGDVVAVEGEGLGRLENPIVEGARPVSRQCGAPPTDSEKVRGVAVGEGLRE
jgi:5-oxopent-3-ene-1,2,5-tricarboxylate decarboxylase / 2-hydroxyhepta-2,4-diene-1,7-dioate isomerase